MNTNLAMPVVSKVMRDLGMRSFILIDDIIRLVRWAIELITSSKNNVVAEESRSISRLKFLNQIAVLMAAIPFTAFLYGMVKSAFDYKVHKIKLVLPKLPASFNGFRIVQISDIHSGSFISNEPLKKALELIKQQKADVIFFTGDLVNNITDEAIPFNDIFKQIQAPMGVYSTLGNHDYGDYVQWPSVEAKRKNLDDLKQLEHLHMKKL